MLDLYRERRSREFTPAEARVLGRAARHVAGSVRLSLLLGHGAPGESPGEVGLVLLGEQLEVLSADEPARRWLADLAAHGVSGPVPLAVHAVAAMAQRREETGASGPARARVRTASGRWLVLNGFRPRGRAEVATAVVVEPAAPREVAEARVEAFGLTRAERRVLELTLQGFATKEIASALRVSPYTARDHLTRVFDKAGVRSRAQLFALLLATRQVVRAREADEEAILGPMASSSASSARG